ncbi:MULTISPECIES: lipopolysaccharide assembly protein LapB [Flavobacteriaceae]|uniref:tetratricopeptide repeat protein n=1 Tax=Flavobacteriaceae TaxID=49546 RepID=UPI0014911E44|nr:MULTISPECIES: hypothetical protein [Allomuricauda]MDC6366445.1 hypothetical protein [Muricauda sp. AC10]
MKKAIFLIVLMLGNIAIAQEEESAEVFLEEYTDEFQENFFEALKQKGIQNYDRAIDLFLKCKQLEPSNSVMDYELAKAYFLDKQYIKAQEYAIEALLAEPEDFWYLDNLITILEQQGNTVEGIKQSIPYENHKLKENLTLAYFKKKKYNDALKVLGELGSSKFIDELTLQINDSLQQSKQEIAVKIVEKESEPVNDPTAHFKLQLEELLEKSDYKNMKAVAKEALDTYPLQPYFYYAYGTALHYTSESTKAIEVLESGLDYLIDDDGLMNKIYAELSKAYRSIGDIEKANTYENKIKSGL